MKTMLEKLEKCKTCQNRKFRPDCGIVCGLTNEKPAFEDECSEYLANEDLVKQQELRESTEEEREDSKEKLPGANWFRTIAILSIINFVVGFAGYKFIFGLGATEIFAALTEINFINPALWIVCCVLPPIFFLWTWWATAYKGSKLFYNIGWTLYLLDTIAYASLAIFIPEVSTVHIIVDIVLHLLILFGLGFKIFIVNSLPTKFVASAMHKVCYIAFAAAVVITSVYGTKSLIDLCNAAQGRGMSDNEQVQQFVIDEGLRQVQSELPIKLNENSTLTDISKVGGNIVYTVYIQGVKRSDYTSDMLAEFAATEEPDVTKNLALQNDGLIDACFELGYNLRYLIYGADSELMYEYTITSEEYNAAKQR